MTDPIGILIFNKKEGERHALSRLAKSGYSRVFDTSDALDALRLLQQENIGVVLAGLDTGISPEEFRSLVGKIKPGVSVIFNSPFSPQEKQFSISIEEFLKLIKDHLRNQAELRRELSETRRFSYALADRLLQTFALNDGPFFNNHHHVAELSGKIAARMGLEQDIVEAIRMAALLCDLGMVATNQQILEETKKLDHAELAPIRAHPIHTMQILRHVRFPWDLDTIISQHHEHYDGSGYPTGLKGREISIGARIINVAGAYYAITADRPYRRALPGNEAVAEIKKNAGSQFDPEVIDVFLTIVGQEVSETFVRKRVLIFERELNVAAMIKLGTASDDIEVIHATSSIAAISRIRQNNPQVIVADTDALDPETFRRFYHAARQTAAPGRHVILLVPDADFVGRFNERVDYIVKPVQFEEITLRIKGLLFGSPMHELQEGAGELNGRLEDFTLADIIRMLGRSLQTAKVEITRDNEKGVLYLLRGKIVHASVGSIRGPAAFFELTRWGRGSFFILHGQVADEVNVTLDTTHLLAGARNMLDEKKETKNPDVRNT